MNKKNRKKKNAAEAEMGIHAPKQALTTVKSLDAVAAAQASANRKKYWSTVLLSEAPSPLHVNVSAPVPGGPAPRAVHQSKKASNQQSPRGVSSRRSSDSMFHPYGLFSKYPVPPTVPSTLNKRPSQSRRRSRSPYSAPSTSPSTTGPKKPQQTSYFSFLGRSSPFSHLSKLENPPILLSMPANTRQYPISRDDRFAKQTVRRAPSPKYPVSVPPTRRRLIFSPAANNRSSPIASVTSTGLTTRDGCRRSVPEFPPAPITPVAAVRIGHYAGRVKKPPKKSGLMTPDIARPFGCLHVDCHERFEKKWQVKAHVELVHMKERLHNCVWAGCKSPGFPTVLALDQHVRTVHHKRRFQCPFPGCAEEFGTILPFSCHVWNKNLHGKK